MNSCYLLVGRPPPPMLFHVPKCNFVAGRGPRLKILQARGFRSPGCCRASKKSARMPAGSDDEFGLSDDDIADEDDDGDEVKKKKKSKDPSAKSRRKTAIPANSEDEVAVSVLNAVSGSSRKQPQQVSSMRSRRKKTTASDDFEDNDEMESSEKGTASRSLRKKPPTKSRRKKTTASDDSEDEAETVTGSNVGEESTGTSRRKKSSKAAAASAKGTMSKVKKGGRKKATPISDEQVTETKITKRKTKKKTAASQKLESSMELSDTEELEPTSTVIPKTTEKADASQKVESSIELRDTKELEPTGTVAASEEEELHTMEEDDEDVTYPFPPLVCCFGAAQHLFIPSGRPANRMIDYEIHERLKDMVWASDKFVRAPGGSSSSVALAFANLGGRVAFMGKLGDDAYGECMLYHLNVNNVQTRAVKIDQTKFTGLTRMKISRAGGLRATPVRTCAEDNLLSTEICKAVLKEGKIFYFNSMSLLDPDMRKTTMQAIKTSKKFGGLIFYDLNLPLPLWQSRDNTIAFVQEVWNLADVIEVTKQELEFLCGIEPTEKFDTKDNDRSKFKHHRPEVIMPLWHENLKVLFVTNGTSKIHFYTANDHGFVLGMEDAPITPFTADMSAAGDAIVAGLMKMMLAGPDLITDKEYLKQMIKYAISSGVTDQWKLSRTLGFPPREQDGGRRSITEWEFRTTGREEEPYVFSEEDY